MARDEHKLKALSLGEILAKGESNLDGSKTKSKRRTGRRDMPVEGKFSWDCKHNRCSSCTMLACGCACHERGR